MEFAVIIVGVILLILILYQYPNVTIGAFVSVLISIIILESTKISKDSEKVGGGKSIIIDNFPYKKYFIKNTTIPAMLDAIKNLKYVKIPLRLDRHSELKIERLQDAYDKADVIGDLFTEYARVRANVDRHISPLKFWQTKEIYIRLEAKKRFPTKYNVDDVSTNGKNAFALRETIYQLSKEANQFSPSAAAAIYKLVSQDLGRKIDIFDPFAGWGDRMIAAIATTNTTINSYTGIDANKSLEKGYQDILTLTDYSESKQLKQEKHEKQKITFHIADSLKYLQSHKDKLKHQYDLVFTSPPYYNYETYSQDEEQSIKGKQSYQQWMDEFYKPMLNHLVDLVKPGGYLIIHVGPTYSAPTFDKDTKRILDQSNLSFYNNIYFNGGHSIPAFIYKNTSTINLNDTQSFRLKSGGCRIYDL